VAQMGGAARAMDLGPHHEMAAVLLLFHRILGNRRGEAGPAAARLELVLLVEQRRPAADAAEGPRLFRKAGMREGAFGAVLAGHPEGGLAQLLAPFGFGLLDLRHAASP